MGKRVLVTLERPADLTTPVAVMRSLLQRREPCFLLESVEGICIEPYFPLHRFRRRWEGRGGGLFQSDAILP